MVSAAHSPWRNAEGPEGESTELRLEFEARLAELATHGFQAAETTGGLVFARVLVEDEEYSAECLVCPREHTGSSSLGSHPVPLSGLTRVYTCETVHQRDGCCATKKLSLHASEYILCGSTCEEGGGMT
jgi:hypothetical protein